MTTRFESELSHRLQVMADQPGPVNLADQALGQAKRTRRRQVVLAAAAALAVAGVVAVPVLAGGWGAQPKSAPFAAPPSAGTECPSATDEAEPPRGAAVEDWPDFVTMVVAKLPARDDYSLQYAYGVCTLPERSPVAEPSIVPPDDTTPSATFAGVPTVDPSPGENVRTPSGYAVINLGPSREHGHLTVDLLHDRQHLGVTCATLPSPPNQVLFCDDATAAVPMVFGIDMEGMDMIIVTAVYPDGRTISLGAIATPFSPADLRPVVTDAGLAALLLD